MKLTAAKARALRKAGMFADGRNLYLRVADGGSKGWFWRGAIDGKTRKIALGSYPAVTLAQAREKAAEVRAAIAAGKDPLAEKRRAAIPTFAEAARQLHELNCGRWKNGKHTKQWIATLEKHAFPAIGALSLDQIERRDVLAILLPIWTATPETARRVRQRIRSVLKFGMAHGWIKTNAAGEAIDGALPAMPRIVQGHLRSLPHSEVGDALAGLAGFSPARLCLRFVILTACRSGEARGALWDEIQGDTWTIPASRMKAGKEHRVPLSGAAMAVLEEASPFRRGNGLVFPSPMKAGPLSDMALTVLLRKAQLADRATVHGFRSSFRDWCAESGVARELAEAALAHTVGGVEGAYFRSDLFDQRRKVMAAWAAYVTEAETADSNVVRLKRA